MGISWKLFADISLSRPPLKILIPLVNASAFPFQKYSKGLHYVGNTAGYLDRTYCRWYVTTVVFVTSMPLELVMYLGYFIADACYPKEPLKAIG